MIRASSLVRPRSAILVVCTTACLLWLAGGERLLAAEEGNARRALLVGIDRYKTGEQKREDTARGRRHWRDLRGSVNDVRALQEVLIRRQGFRPKDMLVLENEAATGDAILQAFQRHLIAPAKTGDHSIFYYAGHGSPVRNSRSSELDG